MIINKILFRALFLLALSILMNAPFASGQERTTSPFKTIRLSKDENRIKSKIEFWDSLSSQRKNVLDLYAINPFGKFDAKIASRNDFGTPFYQLDTLRGIDTLNGIELVSKVNYHKTKYMKPFNLWSRFVTYTGRKVVAVGFELTTLNKTGENISSHSTVKVYDSEGQLRHETPIWDINLDNTPVVTEDGRFIAFQVGGPYGWEQSGYIKKELWIYDCSTKKIIFKEEDCESGMPIDIVGGKFINHAIAIPQVSTTAIFYDFYLNIKYSIVLTFAELPNLYSIDLNGIYFQNEKEEKYLKYRFDKDFTKTKIF